MATVKDHYNNVLSDVYSWMAGGFENAISRNVTFFEQHNIKPEKHGKAVDLGAGCGFGAIALAMKGFNVTAVDFDENLLKELENHRGEYDIIIVRDEILSYFNKHVSDKFELAVCLTDTIAHLSSKDEVEKLFCKVHNGLEDEGDFVLTYRDMSCELTGTDRFVPVKSDKDKIMLCFLEYESEAVKVHDIVYQLSDQTWNMKKSYYYKLRLSKDWIESRLKDVGFGKVESFNENGFVINIATK